MPAQKKITPEMEEEIEHQMRVGAKTIKQLAEMYGVSHGYMRRFTGERGWRVDPEYQAEYRKKARQAEEARRAEAREQIEAEPGGMRARTEQEVFDEAVLDGAEVLKYHKIQAGRLRTTAERIHGLLQRNLSSMEDMALPEIGVLPTTVELRDMAETTLKLSMIHARMVTSERKSHGLEEDGEGGKSYEQQLLELYHAKSRKRAKADPRKSKADRMIDEALSGPEGGEGDDGAPLAH